MLEHAHENVFWHWTWLSLNLIKLSFLDLAIVFAKKWREGIIINRSLLTIAERCQYVILAWRRLATLFISPLLHWANYSVLPHIWDHFWLVITFKCDAAIVNALNHRELTPKLADATPCIFDTAEEVFALALDCSHHNGVGIMRKCFCWAGFPHNLAGTKWWWQVDELLCNLFDRQTQVLCYHFHVIPFFKRNLVDLEGSFNLLWS